MFNKKLEKRINKLEVVIAGLDVDKDKLKGEIKKINEDLVKAKKPMYKIGEHKEFNYDSPFLWGVTYYQDDLIPITDVIKLILDKMGLEVKSVPAQPEKYVLGKKGEINGH
jgi:hypothetical protein